jgi:hypothetical protein
VALRRRLIGVERWRGKGGIPSDWGRCVLTIGVFDGVHRGHAEIIARAVKAGRARGVPTVLMTFDPHPMEVVFPGSHPAQLTTLARRAELVEELGVDVFLVIPFTPDFMKLTPDRFIHELLVERLHVVEVVVGENFTFGKKAAGNVAEGILDVVGARDSIRGFVELSVELPLGSVLHLHQQLHCVSASWVDEEVGRKAGLAELTRRGLP